LKNGKPIPSNNVTASKPMGKCVCNSVEEAKKCQAKCELEPRKRSRESPIIKPKKKKK
jgi:hypothetical protein